MGAYKADVTLIMEILSCYLPMFYRTLFAHLHKSMHSYYQPMSQMYLVSNRVALNKNVALDRNRASLDMVIWNLTSHLNTL